MAIKVEGSDANENNKPADAELTPPAPQPKPNSSAHAQQQKAEASNGQGGANSQNTTTSNQTINNNPNQGTRMSASNFSARVNYGIGRAPTSHAMRALIESIDKIAEGLDEGPVKFSYHALDGEKEGLLISALVVAATPRYPAADQKFVAHHTLILAATGKGATSVEQQWNNLKYERVVVPADAYDSGMRARINEVMRTHFNGFTVIDADATVVPENLDLKSEEAVRNVVANATTASSTLLSSMIANDAWVITEDVANRTFLNEIKSSWAHFNDLTGNPVRGDVVLEMSELTGKNPNQNQNNQGGEFLYNNSQSRRLITQMLGYIDLTSVPQHVTNNFGIGGATGLATKAEDLKIYMPRLVITNLDAPDEAAELPIVLQGLATAQSLANNANWIGALISQHKNGEQHMENGINIRDLSAMGLEAPVQLPMGYLNTTELPKAGRLPLGSAAAGDAALAAALNTYLHEQLLISADVPECAASSWILSPFAAAARGDQNAINDIFAAADLLTRNNFSPIYKNLCGGLMKPPVFNDNMFVNLGYYYASSGARDIRDMDYLAELNATGDSGLEDINDWSNLQANSEVDPMFRLAKTRDMQRNMFASMVITGRAVRITFNPAFIFALAEAIAAAGLVYETKVGVSAPTSTTRMVPQYIRNMPQNLGNAGAFVNSGMRKGPGTVNGAGSFGRYANNNNRSNSQPGSGAGNF